MDLVAPLKILKASAGSGKTFSLTLHYITLLLYNDNSYREILAVTFTNKATAEMKERVLTTLQGLATANPSRSIENFRTLLLRENPTWNAQSLQQKAHRIYRKIIHDYSRFTISTIDGFSQKVIRSFTYELNLDAAYKIEMNTNKVKQDLTVMLNQLLDEKPDLLHWIIDYAEQKIANNENWNYRQQLVNLAGLIFTENFQEFDMHLTTADAHQVFMLLNKETQEKTKNFLTTLSELIVLFQNTCKEHNLDQEEMKGKSRNKIAAANKINSRVNKSSFSELEKIFERFTTILDDETAFCQIKGPERKDLKDALTPILAKLKDLYELYPNYIAYRAVQTNLYYLRLLKEMSGLLRLWRKENGAQLISDSQLLLNKLGLDENNDPTFIWEKIGNRYNYFLFDEFQDTSRIQWKNYSPLLINALGNAKQQINEHLIVGDVKQSIYRWRNGDWRILLQQIEEQVAEAFHLTTAERSKFIENGTLDINYRSAPEIIALNNYIFKTIPRALQNILENKVHGNLDEQGIQWWKSTGNSQLLIKAYQNSEQQVPTYKINNPQEKGSIEIQYLSVESNAHRRTKVQEESLNILSEKVANWILSGRYTSNQIGILVRSNREARTVIEKLMAYKSEYNKTHGESLTFEVISGDALTLASNDGVSLLIETLKALVYNTQKHVLFRAKMAYLHQLCKTGKTFHHEQWLNFASNDIPSLNRLLPERLVKEWLELQQLPLVHLVEKLIEIYELGVENSIHLPYLLAFKDIATGFSAAGDRGVTQFLEYWEEDAERSSLPANGKVNAIEVTTIHKSKGLAYDVVMIPFCSWSLDGMANGDFWINTENTPFSVLGKIPIKYTSSIANSTFYKQYHEEMLFNYMDALNTFYVATTRAKKHLFILAPASKDSGSKSRESDAKSEYISDILHQVLQAPESPFLLEQNALIIDNPVNEKVLSSSKPVDVEKDKNGVNDRSMNRWETVYLTEYPQSAALQQEFEKGIRGNINSILLLDQAAQHGLFAHEIMSQITDRDQIDEHIDNYIELGVLNPADRPFLQREIHQIWEQPEINKWLTGSYKIWNEADIILKDGKTIRPDKVFSSDKETIVLDFKFTKGDYSDHQYQIDKYKGALKKLGYQNVKGYLYYAKSNQLVEVK